MKKLLLVLIVVAMASFLLVGCLPGISDDGIDNDNDGIVDEKREGNGPGEYLAECAPQRRQDIRGKSCPDHHR